MRSSEGLSNRGFQPLDFLDRGKSQTKVPAKLKDQPVPMASPGN